LLGVARAAQILTPRGESSSKLARVARGGARKWRVAVAVTQRGETSSRFRGRRWSPGSTNAGSLQRPAVSQLQQSMGHERPSPGGGVSQLRLGQRGLGQGINVGQG